MIGTYTCMTLPNKAYLSNILVFGSSLNFQDPMILVIERPGASIGANYNFTNNGTVAEFNIDTFFSLSGTNTVGEQQGYDTAPNPNPNPFPLFNQYPIHIQKPITFTTTTAVDFSLTINEHFSTNTGTMSNTHSNGIGASISTHIGNVFNNIATLSSTHLEGAFSVSNFIDPNNYTQTITGSLDANIAYIFSPSMSASLNNLLCCGSYGSLVGTTGVNLILTPSPVPVPAAVWLFSSALAGFIGFNRRKPMQQVGYNFCKI